MENKFISSDYGGIVLSAGGLKGFYELGVLQHYHSEGFLGKTKVLAGTSIGSFIVSLYSIGYSPLEILEKSLEINLATPEDADFANLATDFGIYKTNRLKRYLSHFFKYKYKYIPTLIDLYILTQKHLILCAYNVNKTRMEYFTWKTEPDMLITDAIMASCAIPIYFKAFHYRGNIYIDGARGEICPLEYTASYIKEYSDRKIMCVTFKEKKCESFMNFLDNIFITRNITVDDLNYYKDIADIIFLPNHTVPFDISKEQRLQLFNEGLKYITDLAEAQENELASDWPDAPSPTTMRHRNVKLE